MGSHQLDFPTGEDDAIVASHRRLSFDDLHRLRPIIHLELHRRLGVKPSRILGCLNDDDKALLALLFVTEITDYMPINPNLSDAETSSLVKSSRADVAVVSANLVGKKPAIQSLAKVLIWDEIVLAALNALKVENQIPTGMDWANGGRLILHTSGSTGMPKRVPITIEAMNASARNIAKGHELSATDHALNALPTFHIGALVDVMLAPFVAGGRISITDQRAPHELVHALINTRPTWFQVVPTLLRRLVEDVDPLLLQEAGKNLRFIRSISAPVPPDLKHDVEQLFGCPIVEMYGMTETAGQIATQSRDIGRFKDGSVGRPVGVKVAIMDRAGNPLVAGQTGEVCVAGPTVFDGYEGTSKDDVFFENWFRTGDLGTVDQDGDLFLKGRLKEMINVGGEKVSPHEVEVAVLKMPEVIEAASYCVPHPTLGEQVGLSIAIRGHVSQDAVKVFLDSQLATFKRPHVISIVDQLPRLANAKVDRVLLKRTAQAQWQQRQASNALDTTTVHLETQSNEARAVALHWSQILKCRIPEGSDDFFDMGGDSLSATQLLLSLEKTLGRQISPNQLFDSPTFSGLVENLTRDAETPVQRHPRPIRYIQEKTAGWPGQVAVPDGLLRAIGSLKPRQPLFWSSQAQDEISAIVTTIGLRRPLYVTGSLRKFKNRTAQDFKVVGEQLASEIMAIQPSGPIALGGFCGGAWVMHHAAEALIQQGREIRVYVSVDYWPSREIKVPTVHCMSRCEVNSGRVNYARHSLVEGHLYRAGVMTLEMDSQHSFTPEHIISHQAVLNDLLDGVIVPPDAAIDNRGWSLPQRLHQPSAKIKIKGRPRFYRPGGTATILVDVMNTSDTDWDTTDISGLSLQVDLINLDGYMRKANVAYGAFTSTIQAGASSSFEFQIRFPNKRVPLWLLCQLTSQGLARFVGRGSGAQKSVVFPSVFK